MGGETPPRLKTSRGILELQGRDNRIYVAASTNPNAVRGADAALVHLTEVGFWKSTRGLDPWDAVRAIYCSVALAPMTMIVMESTADGVGSFFHEEWLRACSGRSDNRAVFVPWHEIGKYSLPLACEADARALWQSLDPYEHALWTDTRLTLEQIHWYHRRRREMKEHAKMKSEFPSTAEEAFACTSSTVFAPAGVKRLRQDCREPVAIGEVVSDTDAGTGPQSLAGLRFAADPTGGLHVWQFPEEDATYVAAVDVGGLSDTADWSVILVLRRGPRPEVVAQWRGHIDHDLLVWKAARIAAYFNRACLVFESNTLESGRGHNAEAPYAQGALILNELYEHYPNLYRRPAAAGGMPRQAAVTGLSGSIPGFHTNRQTKQLIITRLIAAVRDGLYTERSADACDEFDWYERLPSGAYAARPPHHDDLLMTRAIGLHICSLPDDTATDAVTARYLSRFRY